jgi:tripartite-type tricarboxylate transporter receptor subunit TctC
MKHIARLGWALGMALAPSMTHAQDAWPSRSITFIVPYAAGGYTDLVGRMTAHYVERAAIPGPCNSGCARHQCHSRNVCLTCDHITKVVDL